MKDRKDKYVIDTSILAEYIDKSSPYSNKIAQIFQMSKTRRLELYITTVTIAELMYVSTRIYRIAGSSDPLKDARDYINWLIHGVGFSVIKPTIDDSFYAGEIRTKARIALPDCFVIATARRIGGVPLFLKMEIEMKKYGNILRPLGVKFIDEISVK